MLWNMRIFPSRTASARYSRLEINESRNHWSKTMYIQIHTHEELYKSMCACILDCVFSHAANSVSVYIHTHALHLMYPQLWACSEVIIIMLEKVVACWGCMASKEKSQYAWITQPISCEANREWVFPFASLMVNIRKCLSYNLHCRTKWNAWPKNKQYLFTSKSTGVKQQDEDCNI